MCRSVPLLRHHSHVNDRQTPAIFVLRFVLFSILITTFQLSVASAGPNLGSWTTPPQSMLIPRTNHTATLLPNGQLMVAGGTDATGQFLNAIEFFDPFTGTWSAGPPMNIPRAQHSATLLPNGKVLVAGGALSFTTNFATPITELYDPVTNSWSLAGNFNEARFEHAAVLLQDGRVLIFGGRNGFENSEDLTQGSFAVGGDL